MPCRDGRAITSAHSTICAMALPESPLLRARSPDVRQLGMQGSTVRGALEVVADLNVSDGVRVMKPVVVW